MRRIVISERRLKNIIRKTIQETLYRNQNRLNEVSGWTLEGDDIEWTEDIDDDVDIDTLWIVRLWTGKGYYLPAFGTVAFNPEEALENVVHYLDETDQTAFFVDDEVEDEKEELRKEGYDEEEIDMKIDEWAIYVDPEHYVFRDNLSVYPYKEFKQRNS